MGMSKQELSGRVSYNRMEALYERVLGHWAKRASQAGLHGEAAFHDPYWVDLLEEWVEFSFKSNGWTETEYRKEEEQRMAKAREEFPIKR